MFDASLPCVCSEVGASGSGLTDCREFFECFRDAVESIRFRHPSVIFDLNDDSGESVIAWKMGGPSEDYQRMMSLYVISNRVPGDALPVTICDVLRHRAVIGLFN